MIDVDLVSLVMDLAWHAGATGVFRPCPYPGEVDTPGLVPCFVPAVAMVPPAPMRDGPWPNSPRTWDGFRRMVEGIDDE